MYFAVNESDFAVSENDFAVAKLIFFDFAGQLWATVRFPLS